MYNIMLVVAWLALDEMTFELELASHPPLESFCSNKHIRSAEQPLILLQDHLVSTK